MFMFRKDSKAPTASQEMEELSLEELAQVSGDFGNGGQGKWNSGGLLGSGSDNNNRNF